MYEYVSFSHALLNSHILFVNHPELELLMQFQASKAYEKAHPNCTFNDSNTIYGDMLEQ